MDDVLRSLLQAICHAIDWPVGHAYRIAPDHPLGLLPTDCWYLRDPERYRTLVACTRRTDEVSATRSCLGTGLPRRVAASGHPVWIPDLAADPRFLRGRLAGGTLGVNRAFAVPVSAGDGGVAFVLEFFDETAGDVDEARISAAVRAARAAGPALLGA